MNDLIKLTAYTFASVLVLSIAIDLVQILVSANIFVILLVTGLFFYVGSSSYQQTERRRL